MGDSADFSDRSEKAGVAAGRRDWIRDSETLDEHPSSQTRARELASAGRELPFCVRVLRQTAGRGRGENRWSAGEGALAFTVALDPAAFGIPAERIPSLSIATALAVCEALQVWSRPAPLGIKWPNDVYAAGGKLCGNLTESLPQPGWAAPVALVGVGINVNNAVPAEALAGRAAVRLADLAESAVCLDEVFEAVLASLEAEFLALGRRDPSQVERWNARNVLRGRQVSVDRGGEASPTVGICEGLDADGALSLIVDGTPTTIRSASIVAW